MGFMDWLRRNWPDLLIGVALVAVIAGIIATLISGGSFFPFGQGSGGGTPSTPITTPSTQSPTPTQPSATQPGATTPGQVQGGATQPGASQDTQAGSGTTATGGADAAGAGGTDPGIAALPPAGTATGDAAGTGTGSSAGTAAGTGADPAASSATADTESPAQPDSSGGVTALPPAGSQPSSSAATPGATAPASSAPASSSPATAAPSTAAPVAASAEVDEASYRVSVGAFGNEDNAQRLAQQFQGAGYPVLLGTQGNLTIVLLGPYATDAEARRVAGQVDGTFGVVDPTVYRYEPEPGDTTATAGTPPSATSSTSSTSSTPSPSSAQAPAASSSGRYLQVGAYANRESSLPQRQRLEGLGFSVTEVQEGSFLKLLVGPYQGASLTEAQSTLAAEGIENFARGL